MNNLSEMPRFNRCPICFRVATFERREQKVEDGTITNNYIIECSYCRRMVWQRRMQGNISRRCYQAFLRGECLSYWIPLYGLISSLIMARCFKAFLEKMGIEVKKEKQ